MKYVITFDNYDGECECFTVNAPYMELAIMEAKEKAYEKYGYGCYGDSDILSIIRI